MSYLLNDCAEYINEKVNINELSINQYISTDNILQNKQGIECAVALPLQGGNVTAFKKGDVLLANIRPYLKKIWYANFDGGCSADVLAIRARENTHSQFLFYALFRDDFFVHAMKGAKGTKMPRGDKSQIMEFKIPKFDLPTQQAIASVLSALDQKIAINNQINAQLEQMAKTLYDYWFVQFDFPNENGKPYQSSGGEMVYNDTLKRHIPKDWEVKSLGEMADLYQPQTLSEKDLISNGKYFVYGANGIIGKYNEYNHENPMIAVACRGNSCGVINITQPFSWITGNAMVVKPKSDYICIDYLKYSLLNGNIEKTISGSAQPQITRTNLAPLMFLQADEKILRKFADKINSQFDLRIKNIQQNQQLTQLRDFLLPMLMNGQVSVLDVQAA